MLSHPIRPAGWLLLAGIPLIVFLVLYLGPVLRLLLLSLYEFDPNRGAVPAFQLGFYRSIVTDGYFLEILWRTVRISLATTVLCALVSFPLSLYLVQAEGWRLTSMLIILLMPLVTSVIVVSYGWLILLGQKGLVNLTLVGLGVLNEPARLMFSETGIVIALTHVLLVFMVLSLATSLRAIDPNILRAARSLGAGPWRTFWRMVFPLSLHGLRTGALLVFSLSMSAYATPALIGGARLKVFSVLIYQQSMSLLNWPLAATLAVVLLATTTGVLAMASAYDQWRELRAERMTGLATAPGARVL